MFVTRWAGCRQSNAEALKNEEIEIKRGDLIVTITTTGEVKPQNRLEIKPPLAGRVDEILVREGNLVNKGDVLVWMSSTDRVVLLDAMALQRKEDNVGWQDIYRPTPLLAPIAGTVIVRRIEPGQTVTTNDVVLVLADRLIVKAQIDETDVGQIKVGQKALVVLDAYPDEKATAVVNHIAYESKMVSNVIVYEADILPEEIPPHFVSGMTADVTISVLKLENVLLVPMAAVEESDGEKRVTAKEKGSRQEISKVIRTGERDGINYEVLGGLQEHDRVMIKRKSPDKKPPSKKRSLFSPR